MAKSQLHVEAEGTSRATAEVVWGLVADATTYARWGPWDDGGYQQRGEQSAHGLGAVRWFRLGRTTTVERVLGVEDQRRLVYSVERGIPVRNYRAEVTLTPTAAGTHIRWAASFDTTLLGRIVQRKLRTLYPDIVARLVTAADAQPAMTGAAHPWSPGPHDRLHALHPEGAPGNPQPMTTVYEAAGGADGLLALARTWHAKVMADEVVSHAFSQGFHPEHTERLAAYWAEALGGPTRYSEMYGDETSVVRMHSGNGPHVDMDDRAIACFDEALTDVGLDSNDRVRGVLHEYFAWATRTTMSRYHQSAKDVPDGLHIPRWSWDGPLYDGKG